MPPFLSPDLLDELGPCREETGVSAGSFTGEAMGWGQGQRLGAETAPKAQKIEGAAD